MKSEFILISNNECCIKKSEIVAAYIETVKKQVENIEETLVRGRIVLTKESITCDVEDVKKLIKLLTNED